jgi:DNA-binding transcriptional LysR family regulator
LQFRAPGLVSRLLWHEQLIAALPETHPMASLGTPVDADDLDGQDVIMYSPVRRRATCSR